MTTKHKWKLHDLKPLHDWVLVQKDYTDKTAGGIMIVRKEEERPTTGTVVNVGCDVTEFKKGDRVAFHWGAGSTIEHEDEKMSIIKEIDLHGILTDE